MAGEKRREEQPGAEPRRRDPEYSEIDVPRLRDREGEHLQDVDPEEFLDPEESGPFDVEVRQ